MTNVMGVRRGASLAVGRIVGGGIRFRRNMARTCVAGTHAARRLSADRATLGGGLQIGDTAKPIMKDADAPRFLERLKRHHSLSSESVPGAVRRVATEGRPQGRASATMISARRERVIINMRNASLREYGRR